MTIESESGMGRDAEIESIESCEEAMDVLAEYLDGELTTGERAGLERHLEICRSCYSRAEFEKRLKARMAEHRAEVPDRLRDRMRTMIRHFTVTNSPGS